MPRNEKLYKGKCLLVFKWSQKFCLYFMSAVLVTSCNCQGNDRFLSTTTLWSCGSACPTIFSWDSPRDRLHTFHTKTTALWRPESTRESSSNLWVVEGFPLRLSLCLDPCQKVKSCLYRVYNCTTIPVIFIPFALEGMGILQRWKKRWNFVQRQAPFLHLWKINLNRKLLFWNYWYPKSDDRATSIELVNFMKN